MMRRKIVGYECSQSTPGAYWQYGTECYVHDFWIEYPESLDGLGDDELVELAIQTDQVVFCGGEDHE